MIPSSPTRKIVHETKGGEHEHALEAPHYSACGFPCMYSGYSITGHGEATSHPRSRGTSRRYPNHPSMCKEYRDASDSAVYFCFPESQREDGEEEDDDEASLIF